MSFWKPKIVERIVTITESVTVPGQVPDSVIKQILIENLLDSLDDLPKFKDNWTKWDKRQLCIDLFKQPDLWKTLHCVLIVEEKYQTFEYGTLPFIDKKQESEKLTLETVLAPVTIPLKIVGLQVKDWQDRHIGELYFLPVFSKPNESVKFFYSLICESSIK